jgi:hypothetical protein
LPQAVIAVLPFLAGSVAGAIAANVIATVLISVVLTKIESLFIGKPNAGPPPPLNVTQRSTTGFRSVVLGTVRCAGQVVFQQCAGANNKYLFTVVAYAGHGRQAAADACLEAELNR